MSGVPLAALDAPSLRYAGWRLDAGGRWESRHIEVGFGNGEYLVGMAVRFPERLYFGVEYSPKYFQKALRRAAGCSNVGLACADAGAFLFHVVPDGYFDSLHINFPDPWPKTRHRIKRYVNDGFAGETRRILAAGGLVHVASDFHEYFLNIVLVYRRQGFELVYEGGTPHSSRVCKTKYEKHFEQTDAPIFYALLKKS